MEDIVRERRIRLIRCTVNGSPAHSMTCKILGGSTVRKYDDDDDERLPVDQ